MANDPTVASGAARRFVPRGPRLKKRLALAASLGLVAGLGVWIALRWHHITENDAKVMLAVDDGPHGVGGSRSSSPMDSTPSWQTSCWRRLGSKAGGSWGRKSRPSRW